MPDGRTPTITITGPSGAVTLTEINSAYPFARYPTQRRYEERRKRKGAGGVQKVQRRYQGRANSENAMRFRVAYLDADMVTKLQAIVDQAVPTCTVTSYHGSSQSWDMVYFDPQENEEDDFEPGVGPLYWNAEIELLRNDT